MTVYETEKTLDWLYRLRSNICVFMPPEWVKPMEEAVDNATKTIEGLDDLCMRHYKQGKIDAEAEKNGGLMQAFSPD